MTDEQAKALGVLPQFDSRALVFGNGMKCTASMINSEWAVSAAHCFDYAATTPVTVQYKINGNSYVKTATAFRIVNPDTTNDFRDDLTLIHLDSPIPQALAWVAPYDLFDEFEQLGWQVGDGTYGVLSSPVEGSGYRAMSQIIASSALETGGLGNSITGNSLYYNFNGSPQATPPGQYVTRYEGGTGPGDSGGPLYIYSRGRFFNASVVSGPEDKSYRNTRMSTHLSGILANSGLTFAYPKALTPRAVWVAQDLTASVADLGTVTTWADRIGGLTWSNSADGGAGAPLLVHGASPTGLASVRLDGDDAMGLPAAQNPFAGETAMSVVLVFKASAGNAGVESNPFGTTGILDASAASPSQGWSLSIAANGRIGWSLRDKDSSAAALFRGGAANGSTADGIWHVAVATWDGSEILNDNAGDDRNMKLYVDGVAQTSTRQGPYHFNVGRAAVNLVLGNSRTNTAGGFRGEIAEVRLYSGELQMNEVDRLLTGLRARYIAGAPGMVFERPWTKRITVPAGQSLRTRGFLTGGGTSMSWQLVSGPAPVEFSSVSSPNTEIVFHALGTHVLRAMVSNGTTTGNTDLTVDVVAPGGVAPAASDPVEGSWLSGDVGKVGVAGSYAETGGIHTLNGAGAGVGIGEGETYDEGQFVWKSVAGDFDFVARLDSVGTSSGPTRAGLMVRGGPGPTDAAAFVGFAPSGTAFTMRRRDGGWYAEVASNATTGLTLPAYLKLERRGQTIAAFVSANGTAYTPLGTPATVALPGLARVGLFVTSGDRAAAVPAQFSNLSVLQKNAAPVTALSLASVTASGGVLDVAPVTSGSDEPWITVKAVASPAATTFAPASSGHRQVYRASLPASGSYFLQTSADDGNAITFIERTAVVSYRRRFDFETSGNTEGWTGANVTGLTASAGSLTGTASTDDPQVTTGGLALPGTSYTQVAVRLKAPAATTVQLYWATTEASGFAGTRLLTLNYTTPGVFQTLVFDLKTVSEWTGKTITNLRLDPLNGTGTTGRTFEIDYIDISDGQPLASTVPVYLFDQPGDFEGWSATKEIAGSYVLGGELRGTSTGSDPVLTRLGANFPASGIDSFLVRIRSSLSGSVELFWSTTEATGFAAARKVTASLTGDGTFKVVRFPLAGNPEWAGKSIVNLRLDPINAGNADFAIDAIVASDGDADMDGLPDTFELANNLNPLDLADAALDSDGDGYTNLAEYIAGTSPVSAADRLSPSYTHTPGTSFQLSLPGKNGRIYRLMRSGSLTATSWTQVQSVGPLAADGPVTLRDDEGQDVERAFYRVQIDFP